MEKRSIISRVFLITGIVMAAVAVVFLIYALWHPEMSFRWGNDTTAVIYAGYVDVTLLCFILSSKRFWKPKPVDLVSCVLVLAGAFYVFRAIFTDLASSAKSGYLALGLGLNLCGTCLNAVGMKKRKKETENEE